MFFAVTVMMAVRLGVGGELPGGEFRGGFVRAALIAGSCSAAIAPPPRPPQISAATPFSFRKAASAPCP